VKQWNWRRKKRLEEKRTWRRIISFFFHFHLRRGGNWTSRNVTVHVGVLVKIMFPFFFFLVNFVEPIGMAKDDYRFFSKKKGENNFYCSSSCTKVNEIKRQFWTEVGNPWPIFKRSSFSLSLVLLLFSFQSIIFQFEKKKKFKIFASQGFCFPPKKKNKKQNGDLNFIRPNIQFLNWLARSLCLFLSHTERWQVRARIIRTHTHLCQRVTHVSIFLFLITQRKNVSLTSYPQTENKKFLWEKI
jgi:hypothetical protein